MTAGRGELSRLARARGVVGNLASAVGLVLAFPLLVILVGLPVVLVVRLIMAAAAWFGAGG